MDSSNPGPLLGRFKAENAENILKAYRIVMDVKETGKSYGTDNPAVYTKGADAHCCYCGYHT